MNGILQVVGGLNRLNMLNNQEWHGDKLYLPVGYTLNIIKL